MANAVDCFTENVQLIGRPPIGSPEAIQWNLNNGLRMLAEQVQAMERRQRSMETELHTLLRAVQQLR